jgi:hypothetical protein
MRWSISCIGGKEQWAGLHQSGWQSARASGWPLSHDSTVGHTSSICRKLSLHNCAARTMCARLCSYSTGQTRRSICAHLYSRVECIDLAHARDHLHLQPNYCTWWLLIGLAWYGSSAVGLHKGERGIRPPRKRTNNRDSTFVSGNAFHRTLSRQPTTPRGPARLSY